MIGEGVRGVKPGEPLERNEERGRHQEGLDRPDEQRRQHLRMMGKGAAIAARPCRRPVRARTTYISCRTVTEVEVATRESTG